MIRGTYLPCGILENAEKCNNLPLNKIVKMMMMTSKKTWMLQVVERALRYLLETFAHIYIFV